MDVFEKLKMSGKVKISNLETGEVLLEKSNLVVTVGKEWIAGRIGDTPPGVISKMKVGDNASDPNDAVEAIGDLDLNNDAIVSNEAATSPLGGSSSGADVIYTATFPAGNGAGSALGEWKEAGLFAADDTMLSRVTFGIITKTEGIGLLVVWTITVN